MDLNPDFHPFNHPTTHPTKSLPALAAAPAPAVVINAHAPKEDDEASPAPS
jgi:hypothetical protein